MSRVFLMDGTTPLTIFEAYRSLTWNRKLYGLSSADMTIETSLDNAAITERGMSLGIADAPGAMTPEMVFTIEDMERAADEDGLDLLTVHAVEAGLFHARRCLPPPYEPPFSDSHHALNGTTEAFMKELVDNNVGPNAPADRQISGLTVATNQDRGTTKNYKARFDNLLDKLGKVGQQDGIGWEVSLSGADLEFDVVVGADLSSSVVFDMDYDTALTQDWDQTRSDSRNVAYVAGQGEGVDRDVTEVTEGSPTGADRRETFVDARHIESASDLTEEGEEELADRTEEDTFSTKLFVSGPRRYKEHFDLGDLVRVRHQPWNLDVVKRVVEVQQSIDPERGETDMTIVLGRPPSSIRQRMRQELEGRGTQRS